MIARPGRAPENGARVSSSADHRDARRRAEGPRGRSADPSSRGGSAVIKPPPRRTRRRIQRASVLRTSRIVATAAPKERERCRPMQGPARTTGRRRPLEHETHSDRRRESAQKVARVTNSPRTPRVEGSEEGRGVVERVATPFLKCSRARKEKGPHSRSRAQQEPILFLALS